MSVNYFFVSSLYRFWPRDAAVGDQQAASPLPYIKVWNSAKLCLGYSCKFPQEIWNGSSTQFPKMGFFILMETCCIDNLLEICLLFSGIQCSILGQLFNKIPVNHFPEVLPSEGLGLLLRHGSSILPSKGRANLRPLLLPSFILG